MKRKNKNTTLRKAKEFRFHDIQKKSSTGKRIKLKHPAYIFYKKGNIYIYVPITHSSKIENMVLIQLKENPNPKDKRDSFCVLKIEEDIKGSFGKRLIKWRMNDEDDLKIRNEYKKR